MAASAAAIGFWSAEDDRKVREDAAIQSHAAGNAVLSRSSGSGSGIMQIGAPRPPGTPVVSSASNARTIDTVSPSDDIFSTNLDTASYTVIDPDKSEKLQVNDNERY